jgi:hypothetical protein
MRDNGGIGSVKKVGNNPSTLDSKHNPFTITTKASHLLYYNNATMRLMAI